MLRIFGGGVTIFLFTYPIEMKQEQKPKQTPEQIHTILKEIYYNPLTGFQSADKIHRKAKEQNAKNILDSVKE